MKATALILCLLCLMACSTTQAVKTEYIKQVVPDLPAEPTYFRVVWSLWYFKYADDAKTIIVSTEEKEGYTPVYVFTRGEAKNLLKNFEIGKSYGEDLRMILGGLK